MTRTLLAILVLMIPSIAQAQLSMNANRVANGLSSPIFVTHAPGDAERLFICEQSGAIKILNLTTGNMNGAPFMTVPGMTWGGERGLLGLAFHPDYQNNGLFYVNFTDNSGGDTRIQQFTRTNADTGNPASAFNILEFNQPQSNHNGGWIGFGPDGYLYVATGDGGGAYDNGNGHTAGIGNSQDITNNLLGKMLRLDIDNDDFPADPNRNYAIPASNPFVGITGDDEIFAYGLRNPWRCGFDRETGHLYIGDVGQGSREEIDILFAGGGPAKNFGWRLREGTIQTPNVGGAQPPDGINPIYDYLRNGGSFGGFCVTGGYVYRGPIKDLRGHYFFADYSQTRLWSLKFDGTADDSTFNGNNYSALTYWNPVIQTNIGTISNVSSFGEDLDGNLYVVDHNGEVFEIVDASISTTVPVDTATLNRGIPAGGSVGDLVDSDDVFLEYFYGFPISPFDPPVNVEFEGTSPDTNPETICFDLESKTNSINVHRRVYMYNFDSQAFEQVDFEVVGLTEDAITVELMGDLTDYVSNTGLMRARVTWWPATIPFQVFKVSIDQAIWRVIE